MAELLGPWQVVTDTNGNPVPGARIGTFDAVATTTPKATYSDPDLTTPHANPIVADASGKVPQVFVDTGDQFYLTVKTAAGVLLEDYEFATGLGDTGTGTFTRDFDGGGRYELSGDLGVVSQEFGPPEGDDIGGSARMGGWNGTQGDALVIDFAEAEFTGTVKAETFEQGGVTNPFPRLLLSGTATGAATIDIALSADFNRYQLELFNGSGIVDVRVRFSFDDGATYKDGANDYLTQGTTQTNSATQNNSVSSESHIILARSNNSPADSLRVIADIRSQAGHETHVQSTWTAFETTASSSSGIMFGITKFLSFGKATHIQVYPQSGTLTLGYKLTGHP